MGVVGLGAMGAGIAQLSIEAGLETVGREVDPGRAEAAHGRIAHFLTRKLEKGQIDDVVPRASLRETTSRLLRHMSGRRDKIVATPAA